MTDDMSKKDIKRWYHKHKMEYIEDDWKAREENGETANHVPQRQPREQYRGVVGIQRVFVTSFFLDHQRFPWSTAARDNEAEVEALEEFFAPYIAMLPRRKGELISQLIHDRLTYEQVAAWQGTSKQAAWTSVNRALDDLTRLIAEDDLAFKPPEDKRLRDYEAERVSAEHVFELYWHAKFGRPYA